MQPGLRTTDVKVNSLDTNTVRVPVCYIMGPNLIRLQEVPQFGPVRQLYLLVKTSFFLSLSTRYLL